MKQLHSHLRGKIMRFDDYKTDTLNLRVAPSFKKLLKGMADEDNRSMVNMLEVILADYCLRHGMSDPEVADGTTIKRKGTAYARGKAHSQV